MKVDLLQQKALDAYATSRRARKALARPDHHSAEAARWVVARRFTTTPLLDDVEREQSRRVVFDL